jgi:cell wall-associated NlpC family hydrolase
VWDEYPGASVRGSSTDAPVGALVVWRSPTGGWAGHVGISIGGGQMINATGGVVKVSPIAGFGRTAASYCGWIVGA